MEKTPEPPWRQKPIDFMIGRGDGCRRIEAEAIAGAKGAEVRWTPLHRPSRRLGTPAGSDIGASMGHLQQ
jgi:hypothetical protein